MEAQRWSRRDVFCVHLAVHEALSNAILHGNQKDPRKHVHFDGKVSAGWVRVEIADEGSGFDPDALPDPTAPAHRQRCEGRGVMLMQALMSRVAFHDQGRQVVLEKDRS